MDRTRILSIALATLALLPAESTAANQRPSIERLTDESDTVVLGSVVARSSRWANRNMIFTDVVIAPDVTLKGSRQTSLVVRVPGGIVGNTEVTVSDTPEFSTGERVLVYLLRDAGHYEVVGRDGGKFAASSNEAADAVARSLRRLEDAAGQALEAERRLAGAYLDQSRTERAASPAEPQPNACYIVSGSRWPSNSTTYRIGNNIPSNWIPAIQASTAAWNESGVAFTFRNDSSSINEVSMADLVAEYGSSYTNTYAVAITWTDVSNNRIEKAEIQANTRFPWSTNAQPQTADVQNIMTHEFGHWLRLMDVYSPSVCNYVTMWGSSPIGETSKRSLEAPDVAGAVLLYGRVEAPVQLKAPILISPANGASGTGSSVTLMWTAVTGAAGYDVYFGTTPNPPFAGSALGITYAASAPGSLVTYYWRVVARNDTSSEASPVWSFTTAAAGLQREPAGRVLST